MYYCVGIHIGTRIKKDDNCKDVELYTQYLSWYLMNH